MQESVPTLPESLSAEARAANEAVWAVRGSISMGPPARTEAAAWRAQLNEAFRAPPEVLARFENQTTRHEIAGVQVLRIAPRGVAQSTHAIVYFHGGGYTIGEPEEGLAHGLAHAARLPVYSVDYRKAPEHAFPAAQDDACNVYQQLSVHYGADRLVVAGCSAGGGLAFSAVLRARDEGRALPAALVGISPWVDLADSGDSLTHISPLLEPLGSYQQAGLGEAARSYAGALGLRDPRVSPLFADYTRGFCPVFVSTGTRDWFLSSSAQLTRVLRRAGVPASLSVWEGLGHAFEVQPIPEAFESHAEMGAFIRGALGLSRKES